MSNNQDQQGSGVEAGSATQAGGVAPAPTLDNALTGMADTLPLENLGSTSNSKAMVPAHSPIANSLSSMLDVPIPVVFEVGRTKISIAHLMELRQGSFIDLRNVSVDVIDVLVDEKIVAEAEAISLQQRYGVRISEITRIPSSEDGEDAS
ncbi:MAG: flagellar motor switch protein [Pseudohongiella sp.]|nr:MAG: flagellar motor switch protein [Pseudohongiella sp.]